MKIPNSIERLLPYVEFTIVRHESGAYWIAVAANGIAARGLRTLSEATHLAAEMYDELHELVEALDGKGSPERVEGIEGEL